jgi:hypothetical protein
LYDLRFLVDAYVSTDPKNPSKSILRVKQPHNFFSKDLYENESTLIEAYRSLVSKVVELISGVSNSTRNYKEDVTRMLDLEKDLALVTTKMFEIYLDIRKILWIVFL